MITPAHAQMMARYNTWQNDNLYSCADRLSDMQRKEQRGAFFGSIHGTLCHLVFGDQAWMFRFTGDPAMKPPAITIAESATAIGDWHDLKRTRKNLDAAIITWSDRLSHDDLAGGLTYFSGVAGRDMTKPRWAMITHMFNHQTHHRGQVHCLLTQFGQKPGDTDIPFMEL